MAIGQAIEAELGKRQGQRTDLKEPELSHHGDEVKGRSDAIAAQKAGFESRRSYRDAKTVVTQGTPELVEAMDKNEIAVSTAAKLAPAPVEDIIEIGRELTAVKARLEHGQFLPWINAEFGMSQDTASRMMNVATRFGHKIPQFAEFVPSVVYALAAPSTPDAVVEHAIEKAEAGDKVTVAEVQEWKAAAPPSHSVT